MRFEAFDRLAREIFENIPDEYRDGVDGLDVTRRTVPHPSLPEVFTLGECLSEFYPSDFGGPGEVRSRVVLYYGSFLELSRRNDEWDWDDEIWETITHEIRHHLEHLASEDALEEMDYAEDQNFARREGDTFDPFFFRSGEQVETGVYQVDGDLFIEREVSPAKTNREMAVSWSGEGFGIEVPEPLADVHFLTVENPPTHVEGDLIVVLVRRRGVGEWVRGLFGRESLKVEEASTSARRLDPSSV